ncbi:MAG: hypothetical protein R2720_09970 [Candidatus Nanopelagicales bacterium]
MAEAAADLNSVPSTTTGPSDAEIVALLLMGIGGIVLPPIAPAIGVTMMGSTPRWTIGQVRRSWGILSVGLLAALGLFALATISNAPGWVGLSAALLLVMIVTVGPAAALYAGNRPRPGHA